MVAPLSVYAADSDEKAFANVSKLAGTSTWMLFVGSLYVALISVKEELNQKAGDLYQSVKEHVRGINVLTLTGSRLLGFHLTLPYTPGLWVHKARAPR